MRAIRTFKDDGGVTRKNGEEWLITMKDTDAHIPNVYEEVSRFCLFVVCLSVCLNYTCKIWPKHQRKRDGHFSWELWALVIDFTIYLVKSVVPCQNTHL